MIWVRSENVSRLLWECSAPNPHSYTPGQYMQLSYLIKAYQSQLFACWKIFHVFVVIRWLFSKSTFKPFRKTIRVSNKSDPDQAWHFVSPDLGPSCLQRISADNTDRQSVNESPIYFTPWTNNQEDSHLEIPEQVSVGAVWSGSSLFASLATISPQRPDYVITQIAWMKVLNFKNPEL